MKWFLMCLVACGSNDPVLVDAAPHVVTSDEPITLGAVIEGSFRGGTGDAVRIVLLSTTPFDWNFHTHVGGTQVIEHEAQVMAADYTYTPTESSTWNLDVIDNGTAPITVHVELSLYGGMQWSGF